MTAKYGAPPNHPESTVPTKAGPGWGIQVGAYKTYAPAYAIARKAVEKAPDLLAKGIIKVVPLKLRNRKHVYRARILGLSKKVAYRACRTLKRQKIPCMELRLKTGLRLAAFQR